MNEYDGALVSCHKQTRHLSTDKLFVINDDLIKETHFHNQLFGDSISAAEIKCTNWQRYRLNG